MLKYCESIVNFTTYVPMHLLANVAFLLLSRSMLKLLFLIIDRYVRLLISKNFYLIDFMDVKMPRKSEMMQMDIQREFCGTMQVLREIWDEIGIPDDQVCFAIVFFVLILFLFFLV